MIIRTYFGLQANPFCLDKIKLLPHQEDIFQVLQVHSQQGGLCLVLGEPGTGKSVIKESIKQHADKRMIVVSVGRTLHTYCNTVKILCQAFKIPFEASDFKCEKRLIEEAFTINRQGNMLVTIIDDAHLMEVQTLRKLRLLFEDFPKNHNLILVGQPYLLLNLNLKVNEDIKSRITYSVIMPKLNPEDIQKFILNQMDRIGLPHNTFTDEALGLIIRSSDGYLRRVRNLCLASMLETVRMQKKEITLDIVNTVLLQPHWRKEYDMDKI
ncbi:MAG: ISChy3, orf3 [uncultured bacterium]|nr:MAG: ISChy3, orf3 [uncultured bacterium]